MVTYSKLLSSNPYGGTYISFFITWVHVTCTSGSRRMVLILLGDFPKRGYFLGGPYNKGCSISGSILGSPYLPSCVLVSSRVEGLRFRVYGLKPEDIYDNSPRISLLGMATSGSWRVMPTMLLASVTLQPYFRQQDTICYG